MFVYGGFPEINSAKKWPQKSAKNILFRSSAFIVLFALKQDVPAYGLSLC